VYIFSPFSFTFVDIKIFIDKHMSLRRLFSHHSHSGHHRSRNPNSESSEEFRRTFSEGNNDDHSHRHLDDTNEHSDIVKPFKAINSPAYAAEQDSYRTRRRSSVQFLDKKFIQSLSNQTTSSLTTDTDSNAAANASEDVCEL